MSVRTKSAFLGSITSQIFLIVAMGVNLAVIPFALQYISKNEYGAAIVLIQVFWYLVNFDFGLRTALSRMLAMFSGINSENSREVNQLISTAFFAYIILGAFVAVFGPFLANPLAQLIGIEQTGQGIQVLIILIIFTGIRFPLLSFESLLFAQQKQALSNFIVFITGISNSATIAVCVYLGAGIFSFAYGIMLSTVIGSLLKIFSIYRFFPLIKVRRKYFSTGILKNMFSFGFFTTIYSLANQLIMQSDKILIGALINPAAVAVYTITAKIPEIIMTLINKVTENSTPVMLEKFNSEGRNSLGTTFEKLLKTVSVLVASSFWLVISFNKSFVKLWVGAEYYSGEMISIITASFFSILMLTFTNTMCLFSIGKIKGYSFASLAQIIVSIGLSIPFSTWWGVAGIILASNLAALITLLYIPWKTILEIHLPKSVFLKNMILPILYISIPGAGIYFSTHWYFNNFPLNFINFLAVGALFSACMAGFVYRFIVRNEINAVFKHKIFKNR